MRISKIVTLSVMAIGLALSSVTAKADDLEKIQSSGKLSNAVSGVFPPFSFVDETNTLVGFDVDIAAEIARRLNVEANTITTSWDGIIAGLVTGRYDTVIGSMGITEERKKAVDFVGPYYRTGLGIFVRKGSEANKAADLEGKTVGVTLGEAAEKWAREQNKFNIRTYKGLPELLLDLSAGRVEAIVADDIPVYVAISKSNAPVEQLKDENLPRFDVGFAIRKNNPELAAAMKKALDEMVADGTYDAIAKKWVGRDIR
ncbi:transporter substrate-binding domain-containing protein [Brucella sp. BE17]|uniref:transporter substrate-binding domain-containing protein n=1 Tax=Brucella sp. BE17 TaxID=3142977 RepID=UPI0031BA496D